MFSKWQHKKEDEKKLNGLAKFKPRPFAPRVNNAWGVGHSKPPTFGSATQAAAAGYVGQWIRIACVATIAPSSDTLHMNTTITPMARCEFILFSHNTPSFWKLFCHYNQGGFTIFIRFINPRRYSWQGWLLGTYLKGWNLCFGYYQAWL